MSKQSKQPPKVLKRQWLYRSRRFHIEEMQLRFSNGEERTYERINPGHDRAVMVVPMLDSETVLLSREYGGGVSDYYLSLPKGAMDAGENPLTTANRELKEEIGYGAKLLTVIKQLALSPSYMGNKITIVLAEQLYPQVLEGDEPEPIEVVPWSLHELDNLIASEEFYEAYAVAALYMVRDRLGVER
ncbi:MAG: ADP compounds hydrolase NudE [Spongiibacteraceae bacterium]|nr:ADP compounds hydrolase NudE [Spongiibacteraceae bacterium]